jgi:hypothetical protein
MQNKLIPAQLVTTFSHFHSFKIVAVIASLLTLSGCGALHSAPMWAPKVYGMDEVTPILYVEPIMSSEQRLELQKQIELGRNQTHQFYGGIVTNPYFVACLTNECAERFGSYGQRAAAYGDMAIRLTAKGLTAQLVAHEWSHAELYRRVGGWWNARRIPRWFDEGVAVIVANEPKHSHENWQEIHMLKLATPKLAELISFGDWGRAVQKYGETSGDVPTNKHVVYTEAGHEVRTLLECRGQSAAIEVLDSVRSGEDFDGAYERLKGTCSRQVGTIVLGPAVLGKQTEPVLTECLQHIRRFIPGC